jgi:hypothetical protein
MSEYFETSKKGSLYVLPPFSQMSNMQPRPTLAVLNIVPPEQKKGGSIADDSINLAHLLGMLHIVNLIC